MKGIPQGHHLAVAGDEAGEFQGNAHHLAAAGGEQHPVEIAGGQLGQGAGAVDGDLMGVAAGANGRSASCCCTAATTLG